MRLVHARHFYKRHPAMQDLLIPFWSSRLFCLFNTHAIVLPFFYQRFCSFPSPLPPLRGYLFLVILWMFSLSSHTSSPSFPLVSRSQCSQDLLNPLLAARVPSCGFKRAFPPSRRCRLYTRSSRRSLWRMQSKKYRSTCICMLSRIAGKFHVLRLKEGGKGQRGKLKIERVSPT